MNTRKAGNELVAAGYCMYSSSTVLVLTVRNGVYGAPGRAVARSAFQSDGTSTSQS